MSGGHNRKFMANPAGYASGETVLVFNHMSRRGNVTSSASSWLR